MTLGAAHARAVWIWLRFGRRLDIDDLKAQASLLSLSADRADSLYFDLFDYAEKEYRRRPIGQGAREAPEPAREIADPWIRRVVSRLRPQQRKALTLVFLEERTQREAARIMKVTDARVSQVIKAALESLRKQIKGSK